MHEPGFDPGYFRSVVTRANHRATCPGHDEGSIFVYYS